MKKLLEKVKELFEKFKSQNKKIKIAVIASIVAVLIAIVSAVFYSTSNKYAVLFSNLDTADAKTVVDRLTTDKVENKIDSSTNTIWVPKNQVDKLKLELAPELKSGSTGYELMDEQSSFGMTDEEFKLKKKRMLEGEIEKVIKSLQPIDNAKVNITVIDQNSNLLTKDINEEANGQASSETISKQHKAEQEYEDRLQKSIVSLLEPIVGKGNVTAVVKANLDFDSKQQTETTIDPNKVIVSQETLKETNKNGDGTASESPVDNNMSNEIVNNNSSSNSSKEEQKTNYDSGKSESKTIQAQGKVDRLTATVYLNKTLTQEQKQEFEDGVANAIGIDATRGDQITVSGMTFDTSSVDKAQAALEEMNAEEAANKKTMMMIAGGIAGAILLGAIIFFILKRRKKKEEEEEQLLDTLIDDTIIPKEPDTFDPIEFETKTQKSHLENEIKKYATEKPEQVVEIIKSWLTENER